MDKRIIINWKLAWAYRVRLSKLKNKIRNHDGAYRLGDPPTILVRGKIKTKVILGYIFRFQTILGHKGPCLRNGPVNL